MDLKDNTLFESSGRAMGKHCSNRIKVRDMIQRYNTALTTDSDKLSNTSIKSSKSSYCGLNVSCAIQNNDIHPVFDGKEHSVQATSESPSRSSSGSEKTICSSRSREPPQAAPREKKARHSDVLEPHKEEQINCPEASYQSKTTISKTPTGVRIIVDIYFDKNKSIAIEDVVGSRVETDIPPSKILKEFQKRVAETSQD